MKTTGLIYILAFFTLGLLTTLACSSSSTTVRSQTPGAPSETKSTGELFRRTSSSDFIATGTITSYRPAGKRLTEKELSEVKDYNKTIGGTLYTFKVEDLICARTDFTPNVMRPVMNGKDFLIFQRRDTPMYENEHERERYLENRRYLMFFTALPEQEELPKKYMLEEGHTYYRAFEGQDGLITLSGDNPPLLIKLRQFCEALSFADKDQKLTLLKDLAQSPDPELRQSAKSAIELVQANSLRR